MGVNASTPKLPRLLMVKTPFFKSSAWTSRLRTASIRLRDLCRYLL